VERGSTGAGGKWPGSRRTSSEPHPSSMSMMSNHPAKTISGQTALLPSLAEPACALACAAPATSHTASRKRGLSTLTDRYRSTSLPQSATLRTRRARVARACSGTGRGKMGWKACRPASRQHPQQPAAAAAEPAEGDSGLQ
jgi:hypothetical protein